jgi:hypothetical protein
MDPTLYSKVRLVRIASHQADASTYEGPWTNSNFQVSLQNELQGHGPIDAFSIEAIGFPNVFPNVKAGFNTFLVRAVAPDADNFPVNATFSYATRGGLVVNFLMVHISTSATFPANWSLITAGLPEAPTVSITPAGVFQVSKLDGVRLLGDAWVDTLFIPAAQVGNVNLVQLNGYPRGATLWRQLDIEPGFYNTDQIGAVVANLLNVLYGAPGRFTLELLTVANIDQRFVLRDTTGGGVSLTTVQQPGSRLVFDNRDFLYQLGFSNRNQDQPLNPNIVAQYLPNLLGETVVYLHSQQIAQQVKGYSGEGQPDYLICTIPIDVAYGQMQHVVYNQYHGPQTVYSTGMTPTVLDFTLKNVFGDFLDIGDNQQAYLTLKLWYSSN